MSRLRRLVVSNRFFFLTCRWLPHRGRLLEREFELLARVVRTVKEYYEKAEYIHLNPVRAGLVERAEDWPWSSVRDYTGWRSGTVSAHPILPIDRLTLPADEQTRL